MPTSVLLELAEVLDTAGFASLEVSGGGAFDSAVHRGVESPWERIRALKAHTKTPLTMAIRGRFLVGVRPLGSDVVRRFVASAADSGIDRFRLHDPLNDVENLRDAAEAIVDVGREFDAGLLYGSQPPRGARSRPRSASPRSAPRASCCTIPPACCNRGARASWWPSCTSCRDCPSASTARAPSRNALAIALEAARRGADLIACAVYPVALAAHRISAEAAAEALDGLGHDTGIDQAALWKAADLIEDHLGDAPATPLAAADRRARRAAQASGRGRHGGRRRAARAQLGRPARRGAGRDRARSGRGGLAAARGADGQHRRHAGARQRARREPLRHDRRRAARAGQRPLRQDARPDRPGARSARSACAASPTPRSRSTSTRCARARRAWPRARRSCCCWRCSAPTPNGCCARSASARAATRRPARRASSRTARTASAPSSRSCRRPASTRSRSRRAACA